MPRILKPHTTVAVSPASVSQLTSEIVLGVDARRYLDLFRHHSDAHRVGRLLVIEVSVAVAHLRSLPSADVCEDLEDEPEDQPRTVNDVLGLVGFKEAV